MSGDTMRQRRLARLARQRTVVRQQALEAASSAEAHHARLADLAARSGDLAQALIGRRDATTAGSLHDMRVYHAAVAGLAAMADDQTRSARQAADARQQDLVRADRSRDLVAERLDAARRATGKARTQRQLAEHAHLARSLNNP